MIDNIFESYKRISYIIKHREAFKKTEKEMTGKVKYGYGHDLDKLFMCLFVPFLGWKMINKIHTKTSRHHFEYIGGEKHWNKTEMLIDWQCAHLTKPNKCKTAMEFLEKYHKEYYTVFQKEYQKIVNNKKEQ